MKKRVGEKKERKLNAFRHFLGIAVVKNLPCNTKNTGLIPGPGTKIPHAAGPQATLEPQ